MLLLTKNQVNVISLVEILGGQMQAKAMASNIWWLQKFGYRDMPKHNIFRKITILLCSFQINCESILDIVFFVFQVARSVWEKESHIEVDYHKLPRKYKEV